MLSEDAHHRKVQLWGKTAIKFLAAEREPRKHSRILIKVVSKVVC